jgi:tRNA-specific 2-thiouridylase
MSGGVDSSVAAALLKAQGYEVVGMTMCFNLHDIVSKKPRCCGIQGIEDARRVAHQLGIKHYVLNMRKSLEEKVIKDFCREYARGRTPNPCVRCNQFLKFDILLKKALAIGARYLATGHYARIVNFRDSPLRKTRYSFGGDSPCILKKAKDRKKDQSYFLYRLNQFQLRHALFPLGEYTKVEVRQLARKFGLSIADKAGSQEICFLPDADYHRFLETRIAADIKPGLIVDTKGNILGRHKGIAFYTIGQREGLGVAMGYPAYIAKIDSRRNRLILGKREEAYARRFWVKQAHFIGKPPKKKVVWRVRIRYNHKEAGAEIVPLGEKIKVNFKTPQFALTPGQSAVFYDRDKVIGGGIIEKVTD